MFIFCLFFFSISSNFFHVTTAQSDFWQDMCGGHHYNKTSSYKQELDNAVYHFRETNNGFGFYNSSFKQGKMVALCRGDVKPEDCQRCVDDATRRARQICPNQTEAAGWYEYCFFRYSDTTVPMDDRFKAYEWGTNNTKSLGYRQWTETVKALLDTLRPEAAFGGPYRKYASGNLTLNGSPRIFMIVQCTPDLSAKECDDCLVKATENFIHWRRVPEVRMYLPSCAIRYHQYRFFNSTWFPALTSSRNSRSNNVGVVVGPISAAVVLIVVAAVVMLFRRYQKLKGRAPSLPESQVAFCNDESKHERDEDDTGEISSFNLTTIQVATNNFSLENKLGEGGFGPVYKGVLEDGKEIAVKRLSRNSGQGLTEFKNEVQLIIKLQHKNLVRLLGCCVQGFERLLLYEFMPNNSLDTILFDANKCKELDWAKRANVVIGIAKGLRYLHEDSRLKIIHRDLKTSNVLLDEDMNSKISDFGTARIFGGNQTEAATKAIIGTYGYMAPEYAMDGIFSTKSDIYSFGVMLLEIISGQRNNRFTYMDQTQNLLNTAWRLWNENKGEQLIDVRMEQDYQLDNVLRWINIALLCVQEDPQDRPTMSTIVFMLEDQWSASLPSPSEPPLSYPRLASCSQQTMTTTAHPSTDITDSTTTSTYIVTPFPG